ncbi:outer membrane efflux lipoprotein [Legionella donaldsonii]|uniref:Outer membrane efflux lipoprotein n=1 Tax=Legionella donaldsonii TaxID=45060 RepID=A0A378J7K5_9GAMM|nr:efflux transporter outer membrane subunit [Legionella donaldsonii]STX43773.1 outer membrane efflux lipoprotein [Legionella donaldsonii]
MWVITRILIFVSLVTLLTSCSISLPPHAQVKHLRALPNMEKSVKKNLNEQKIFTQGDWPDKQWWLAYHSPELNALIASALATNPSIQEMRSRIVTARQEAIVARSVLFPLVFFDATENRQFLSKNGLYRALNPNLPLSVNLVDLTMSFNYEFDFWGQNHNLFYEAIGKEKAQRAEAAQVELIVTTALAQAFFAYQTNLIRKELYEQLVSVRQSINDLQNLMQRSALSSALPSYLAAENLFEAKRLLSTINEELAVDKHLINVLAGRGPDCPLMIDKKLPALPKKLYIPQTLSIDLIARRPDLMAQIWRAKAFAFRTGAAMAEYYPNVNIIGLVGLESTHWKKLFDRSSATTALRPAIHLPIFTAGAIRANIRGTKAEFDAAIFAYNNLLLRSTQEVLDVLAFARSVYQQKQDQVALIVSAEKRLGLTQLRQQKGLDSQFSDYALREEVIEQKLINTTLLYNQYLASVKLTKVLGGGYCQTEIPLVRTA